MNFSHLPNEILKQTLYIFFRNPQSWNIFFEKLNFYLSLNTLSKYTKDNLLEWEKTRKNIHIPWKKDKQGNSLKFSICILNENRIFGLKVFMLFFFRKWKVNRKGVNIGIKMFVYWIWFLVTGRVRIHNMQIWILKLYVSSYFTFQFFHVSNLDPSSEKICWSWLYKWMKSELQILMHC